MATLIVTTRAGESRDLSATAGHSVMEIIRDAGIEELLAACGGCLSCATCHIIIDPDHAARLPPMSAAEADLLDDTAHRLPTSRLSCQIPFDETLNGLRVQIAPEA